LEIMPSKAQLKARADFVKNYAKKKKGSKSKAKVKLYLSDKKLLARRRLDYSVSPHAKAKKAKDDHDTLYDADRREWKRLMTQTKFGRLAKLAQKKGW